MSLEGISHSSIDGVNRVSVSGPWDSEEGLELFSALLSEGDFLGIFLYELSQFSNLLTSEEEKQLFDLWKNGDLAARDQLVCRNYKLVISVAMQYIRGRAELPDLTQEGFIGLIKSVEKFRDDEGARLGTYATWWIRQFISRYLKNSGLIRLSQDANYQVHLMILAIDSLEQEGLSSLTSSQIAEKMNQLDKQSSQGTWSEKKVEQILQYPRYKVSLDKDDPTYNGSDSKINSIPDEMEIEQIIEDSQEIQEVRLLVDILARREPEMAEIVRKFFGFDGESMSAQEIADDISQKNSGQETVTRQAIESKLKRAISLLEQELVRLQSNHIVRKYQDMERKRKSRIQ